MHTPLEEHFDRFAPSYDRVNHLLSLGLDERWRARVLGAIPARPRLRILDLCAGTLACTRDALRRFPGARVTAVDFCRSMLEAGLARIPAGSRGRVELVCADVLEVELPPASFDVVLCSWGMRHLPDRARVLSRVRGWLAPGGELVVFDFFRPSTWLAMLFHRVAGKHLLPLAGSLLDGFGPAYVNLYVSIDRFATRAEFERLLRRCGYAIRRSEDMTAGIVSLIVAAPAALP